MIINSLIGGSGGTDTSQDTVTPEVLLSPYTAHDATGEAIVGTMVNKGAVTGTISTKAGQYTIPAGYHNGKGKVGISSTEQSKIIPANIKSGVKILGVTGTASIPTVGTLTINCPAYWEPSVYYLSTSGIVDLYPETGETITVSDVVVPSIIGITGLYLYKSNFTVSGMTLISSADSGGSETLYDMYGTIAYRITSATSSITYDD